MGGAGYASSVPGISLESFLVDCPAMLFVAGPDGALLQVSGALEQRLGHRLTEARTLAALAEADDGPAISDFLEALAGEDGEAECELHAQDADGAPLALRCVGRRNAEGKILGRVELGRAEAAPEQERLEHLLLWTILDNLDLTVWVVDQDGVYQFQDGKALASTGLEPNQFRGTSAFERDPEETERWVRPVLEGETLQGLADYGGKHWQTWAVPLEMDEERTWCAGVSLDVTQRVEAQRALEKQLETVRSQQAAILELSAPVLNVWDNVLAVPLIGVMDNQRTDELSERLLALAHRARTRFAILDLTGVEAIDTSIVDHIRRLLASLKMLGVDGLITGVSPEVAQTMVAVGVDLEGIQIQRTLREGLRHCMGRLGG